MASAWPQHQVQAAIVISTQFTLSRNTDGNSANGTRSLTVFKSKTRLGSGHPLGSRASGTPEPDGFVYRGRARHGLSFDRQAFYIIAFSPHLLNQIGALRFVPHFSVCETEPGCADLRSSLRFSEGYIFSCTRGLSAVKASPRLASSATSTFAPAWPRLAEARHHTICRRRVWSKRPSCPTESDLCLLSPAHGPQRRCSATPRSISPPLLKSPAAAALSQPGANHCKTALIHQDVWIDRVAGPT